MSNTDHATQQHLELLCKKLMQLVADQPGHYGRLLAARIIGGSFLPAEGVMDIAVSERYMVDTELPLRELVALVDSMLAGGLLVQTLGQRPTLVLTRAGHRALDALEA